MCCGRPGDDVTTTPVRARGTSNTNDRGNTKNRAARRAWLLSTYAADVFVVVGPWSGHVAVPAARCYRCGTLLHDAVELPDGTRIEATLTIDRIVPHAHGGTYRRTNIRPACAGCNSTTGGALGAARKAAR